MSRRTERVDISSPAAPIRQIAQLALDLAGKKPLRHMFRAAGIAVPGLARPDGTVWAPNLPGWKCMALTRHLQRLLGIPVVVESDRNAAVLGEAWRGAARGKSDAIVLIIGTGIGAGILSGGRVVRGAHELSGCAGWLVVTDEQPSEASRLGQLEALVAGPAIAAAARRRLDDGEESSLSGLDRAKLSAHEVAAAARRGDPMALDIFRRCGTFLGWAVANMISLFDPEIIVLGGGMADAADLYLDSLKAAMLERAQPLAAKKVKIRVSKLGNAANLLGCASLAWGGQSVKKA